MGLCRHSLIGKKGVEQRQKSGLRREGIQPSHVEKGRHSACEWEEMASAEAERGESQVPE